MLEEKDKEIEGLKVMKAQELAQYLKDALPQYINQDKISFAVEKLKEVKKLFEEKYTYDVEESDFAVIYETDIDEIVDQQIKELKEKK